MDINVVVSAPQSGTKSKFNVPFTLSENKGLKHQTSNRITNIKSATSIDQLGVLNHFST